MYTNQVSGDSIMLRTTGGMYERTFLVDHRQLKIGLTQNLITDENGTQRQNGRTVAERYCKDYEYFMPKDALNIRREIGIPDPEAAIATNKNREPAKPARSLAPTF